jgi:hypothetical protein
MPDRTVCDRSFSIGTATGGSVLGGVVHAGVTVAHVVVGGSLISTHLDVFLEQQRLI